MTAARPLLAPSARRLWRDRETLQLGRTPGSAVVLAGIGGVARSLLALLDGSRDRAGVLRDAPCPPDTTTAVLTLLEGAGLVTDAAEGRTALAALERGERDRLAPDLVSLQLLRPAGGQSSVRRRREARVVVAGAGRVGAPLAALLAVAGVGAVDVVDEGPVRPEDCGVGGLQLEALGRCRGDAARDLLAAVALSVRTVPVVLPDLVVLAPAAGQPLPEAPGSAPHLVAEVREATGVVGPLVLPGISACLHCLDLARTDRDPGWPALAAQLSTPTGAVAACDGPLALAVAAQAAQQVLAHLDGLSLPASLGGTLELALPDWRWRRRSWQLHPACGCAWRATG
ncbi:MAG: ThiF family adenylyltransferase [Actinobacteria bacterium]|nr:ThiF family adenylyltransferase [Actinomycetota bacterium]MCA1722306.1 ThiF family adenylyltransferase [Actinomycetota bacterium]